MTAYEVKVSGDGTVEIGLLKDIKIGTLDPMKLREAIKDPKKGNRPGAIAPVAPMPPATPAPMGGGRGGERGGAGMQQANDGSRTEKTVYYVPLNKLDEELAKQNVVPALSVYPVRMMMVQASFPLKEQLELIRRALRLKTLAEAEAETRPPTGGQGPTFTGFEVERRIVAPNGQVYDWAPYDHVGQYVSRIGVRKFADQPDDGYLSYFLRYDQKMAMPLPALASNVTSYPGVRLPAIVAGYNKLVEANKQPRTPTDLEKQFQGKGNDNPFMPSTGAAGAVTGPAAGGGAGSFMSSGPAAGIGSERGSPRQPSPTPPPGGNPMGSPALPQSMVELEHMLIRFLDVDIRPGFSYQYRLRVKMKNPNYKSKLVARPADAEKLELFGDWKEIGAPISVPMDNNMYAGDPIAYTERLHKEYRERAVLNVLDNNNGETPVVQFQSWTERVPIDSGKSEPAGYWVVAEVPVKRGDYVGRKQLVPMPMWSSEKVAYILQELPKYKLISGTRPANDQPKGLLVDFSTQTLLVDYEGGKVKTKLGDRVVEDEADTEMMFLKPDGTVTVRNSGVDRENADRKEREEAWRKWLDEIKQITNSAGALTNPGAPTSPFRP
jgi:hypothetical protein